MANAAAVSTILALRARVQGYPKHIVDIVNDMSLTLVRGGKVHVDDVTHLSTEMGKLDGRFNEYHKGF